MAVLLYETRGGIAYLTLNRPDVMNAINREMAEALARAWVQFNQDPEAHVAIITGTGDRAFCAGADLKERARSGIDPQTEAFWNPAGRPALMPGQQVLKPVIAAINGYCLAGGLELALACDIRIAADGARFGLPEIRHGFFPGGGGPQRLARTVPATIAMEMLLTGDPIDAQEAWRIGLVSRVVPKADLMQAAGDLAQRILRNAPRAVRAVREVAYAAMDHPLDHALRFGQVYRALVGTTPEAVEGPRTFATEQARKRDARQE
jgi:enoyl-CoA hydratase/carnithine racemase